MGLYGSGTSGIGTGIVVNLYDGFSANGKKFASTMSTVEGITDTAANNVMQSMSRMKVGMGAMFVGAAVITPFIAATSAAMNFQEGMAKINTTAQLSQDKLADLRSELLDIGAGSTSDINKIPDAYEKIISQTGDAALSLDILKVSSKGAMAGFTDIDTVAGALAQTLSIVGKENTNATEVMDTLFATKRVGAGEFKDFATYLPTLIAAGSNLGYTFKETAGIFAYFTGKGQDAASSAMLMQNAFSALQKTDIADGLAKAGVAVYDSQGKMRGIVDIFTDLNKVTGQMSQQQKSDFLAKVGLRDVQARNAFAIMSSDLGKLQEAMSATGNPAGELGTALKKGINPAQEFKIAINELKAGFIDIGTVFLPIATTIGKVLGSVFSKVSKVFRAIADNPVGQFVLKLIGIVGALTIAIGAAIVAINFKKYAIGQLATSLLAMGKTELATTLMTQGFAAACAEAAAAVIPLLIELLPFIAIGLAIVGVIALLNKSVSSFSDLMDGTTKPASGFLGVMQKIGGVLKAVGEIWSSATNDGYSLSKKTAEALKSIGIYEFVLNLATWLVRVKAFFGGVWDGLSGVLKQVGKVAGYVWAQLNQLADAFGFDIGKSTSNIEKWISAGKILGYVVGGILLATFIPLTLAVLSLGAALLVTMIPLIIILGPIYAVYYAIKHWGEIIDWISKKWDQFINYMTAKISAFVDSVMSISSMFIDIGSSMVDGLWNGILGSWDWLKTQFVGLISELPGGSILMDVLGVGGGDSAGNVTAAPAGGGGNMLSPMGIINGESRVAGMMGGGNTESYTTNNTNEVIVKPKLYLDGKEIKQNQDKHEKLSDSRK